MRQKLALAGVVVGSILFADIVTKRWALATLHHGYSLEGLPGVPLTLAFNRGIAFGLPLPDAGRWLVVIATFLVLIALVRLFIQADRSDWLRLLSIELVAAGAIGNLIDRLRWDRGVVDFIGPIDLGFMHWPIFNIADMAISTGALLLAISLWREDAAHARAAAAPANALEERA